MQDYRTAMALNNMAISLLHVGHYAEALRTCSEGLQTMQSIFMPNNLSSNNNTDCPSSTKPNVSERLKRARARLLQHTQQTSQASSERTHKKHPQDSSNNNNNNNTPSTTARPRRQMDIHEFEDDEYVAIRNVAMYGPSSTVAFPVRLRESVTLNGTPLEIAFHVGLMLYNQGVLNIMAASNTTTKKKKDAHMSAAARSLEMAQKTFGLCMERAEEGRGRDDLPCILFAAITLNCLSLVFRSMNEKSKAVAAQKDVMDLFERFDGSYYNYLFEQRISAPAA